MACPQARDALGNQAMMNGARDLPVGVGDFIFGWLCEGSAISEWGSIMALRHSVLIGSWETTGENCLPCGNHRRDRH